MTQRIDHLVIGAGHNGLACAIELARRGRSVQMLEARDRVGGLATTREFSPGYRVSAAAHLLYGLPDQLIDDWQLERHGLRFAARRLPTCALQSPGSAILIDGDQVLGVSAAQARAWKDLQIRLRRHAGWIKAVNETLPFSPLLKIWTERWDAFRLALQLRLGGQRGMRDLLRIAGMNAYDLLTESLDSPGLQGALAFDATLGAEYAARSPGTVLTLLHRLAGEIDAAGSGLSFPVGGMGSLCEALAAAAREAGVQIRTGAPVERILVDNDRACGVRLQSGETIRASTVISNVDPRQTFLRLLGTEHLDTGFVRRMDHFRARGLVARLHLALDGAPTLAGLASETLGARLLIAPGLDALEAAFNPSKYRELPSHPALEVLIPTVHDASLAPPGHHVLSASIMFVPYDTGADPAAARAQFLDRTLEILEPYLPGLRSRIIASEMMLPVDIEREFRVSGGHWHHGALGFDQYFFNRPVAGASRYLSPVPGLFLCGAGSHPGGGITCRPGRNAARAILQKGI